MIHRIICALLLLPFLCCAQTHSYTLNGSLGVESGETFTYQLVFSDSAGYIDGYATTYLQKEKDTRASITGKIDRNNKTLSFVETGIVYNNGFRSNAIICLIKSTLQYRREGNRYVLAGGVTSKDVIGRAACAAGSVRFEESAEIDALFRETTIAPSQVTPQAAPRPSEPPRVVVIDKTKPATPKPATPVTPQRTEITEGRDKIYEWQTDTVIFEIRDGGRIDDDVVTVRYNNATILDKYTLTKDPKRIILPLTNQETNVITVIAGYEGNEPPNTADIVLRDGDTVHEIVAHNRFGKEAHIRIQKKK